MCDDCAIARECGEFNWRRYNALACVWCAARLIQSIGHLPIAQSEASTRRKAVVAAAAEFGLDEPLIRKLAKGPLALLPLPEKKEKKK